MHEPIRWGILGTGAIAKQFARAIPHTPGAQLLAVASRSQEGADAFGKEFDVPRRYARYEDLVADPEVDVVYVASPHSEHKANSILALQSGKHVLCEKPFCINADETREVVAVAQRQKRFLMEAMWTRYFPAMERVRALIAEGDIGEPRLLSADFGFKSDFDPTSRLFDPNFGGGSLLDVGVYPISLAFMIFGRPAINVGVAHLGSAGTDEQAGMILGYEKGELAVLHSAIRVETPQEAIINGTAGRIRIHSPWWCPSTITVHREGSEIEAISLPYEGNGYQYEAIEVGRCLREGLLESALMPLNESIAIMECMDSLRRQWGLRYPMERHR
ncbi:MAG: oxidoreductase [Candidatus Hydrogenedentota bacterium]